MSQPIDWTLAQQLISAYESSPHALQTAPGTTGSQVLKSFLFDLDSFTRITSEPGVVAIRAFMAVTPGDQNKQPDEQSFTIILAGLDKNGEVVPKAVEDHAKKCPPYCNL